MNRDENQNTPNPLPNAQQATGQQRPDASVYPQPSQNVQPPNGPRLVQEPEPEATKHGVMKWPTWLKVILFPVFAIGFVALIIIDGIDVGWGFKTRKSSGVWAMFQLIGSAILLAFAINSFVFQSYQVVGQSMFPTLDEGDRLIINKLGKTWSNIFSDGFVPNRGDIIVFDSPLSTERRLVKRVIGVPGDRVVFDKGTVTIYNEDSPEGFQLDASIAGEIPIGINDTLVTDVTEDHLFVAGDNRISGASLDSRNDLGLVPTKNVVGDLVLRLLPLEESRFF